MKHPTISLCIVSYNTRDYLKRCLSSIDRFGKGVRTEVIVVDNASTDGSTQMVAEQFPHVRLICNSKNRLFSKANNQALAVAKGKYVFFLNPDVLFISSTLSQFVRWMESHPNVGAIEPRQVTDGRDAPTGSLFNTPFTDAQELTMLRFLYQDKKKSRQFRQVLFDRKKNWKTQVISGASIFARTDVVRSVGGFDLRLHLYYTDVDLCRKIIRKGWKIWHIGSLIISHAQSQSTRQLSFWNRSGIYARDAFVYYWTTGKRVGALLLFLLMTANRVVIATKRNLALTGILVLAAFLRLYRLPETMMFIGDFGHDYLMARDALLRTSPVPLLGIPSSVPWLAQGPYGVWLTMLGLFAGKFHPVGPAIVMGALGVVAVLATYKLAERFFNRRIGLMASLLVSTSPLVVAHARMPFHISPIPLLVAAYLLALGQVRWFWSGVFAGLLVETELSNTPLVLLLPLWLSIAKSKKISLVAAASGLILPMIPRLVFDFHHGFTQSAGFVAWMTYRLGRFTVGLWSGTGYQSLNEVFVFVVEYGRRLLFGL